MEKVKQIQWHTRIWAAVNAKILIQIKSYCLRNVRKMQRKRGK